MRSEYLAVSGEGAFGTGGEVGWGCSPGLARVEAPAVSHACAVRARAPHAPFASLYTDSR